MRFPLKALFVLGLALLSAPVSLAAQSAPFQGTFVLDRANSDDVNRAIDNAVAKMNFVTRPIARGRLRKTNAPYERVAISHTAQQISITSDSRAPIVSPANGTPIKWTREDGEVFDVSQEWEDGALEQSFRAEDGQRVNRFTVSPDGNTLTMQVTVTSPRLAQPLVYRLRYSRR